MASDSTPAPRSSPAPGRPGPGITGIGILVALCCTGSAGVNVLFETTDRFTDGPDADYASGSSVMNRLVAGLKAAGAAVALSAVAGRPRLVRPALVGVLVWGAFATLGVYALGGAVQAVGMVSGLVDGADRIGVASAGYLLFFILIAAGFGTPAVSWPRRYDLRKGAAALGLLGAPALPTLVLLAIPMLPAALGVVPGL
ncbi:hypothetical protein [Nocardiopsis composta]|uniref:Uncharacterized protein n=1 Tax=Nocardiopsis composta TaxID=157465 RepID=A0A7W8VF21_9ACTN|nr:hypothetical protein [Nocardiopsis composta]MBB5433645.1 hypothetical protein [Nocardiopsis composta]